MTLGNNKMKKMISVPAKLTISALTMSMMALSHSAMAGTTITNLSTTQVSPSATELRFSFSSNPIVPRVYELKNPSSLVLEFDSASSLPQGTQSINTGVVDTARAVSGKDSTRVTVLLDGQAQTSPARIEGHDLVLTVNGLSAMQSVPVATPTVSNIRPIAESNSSPYSANHTTAETVADKKQNMVVKVNPLLKPNLYSSHMSGSDSYEGLSAVNFSGNGKGGSVAIDLTNESIPVDVQRQGNKIVVRMMGATIPRRLMRHMKVNSALVESIDAKNKGRNGTVIINMNGDFEYQAYQSGGQLNISVAPPKMLSEPTLEEKVYSGEPLSMEFQDVEIRNVLDILSQFTQMNIVASDEVAGSITLRLINVPWDQALDIILKSKNLGKRVNGLRPIRTEYIKLSYAKAADVSSLISSTSGSRSSKDSGGSTLLSKRGTVTIDSRTNMLIVQDTSESIENIRALVAKIDIPVKQVMIEARIVSA